MCRGIVLFSVVGILLFPQTLSAQQAAGGNARPLRFQKYVPLQVIGGRIEVCQRRMGQSHTVTAGQPDSGYRQHLQVQVRPPCVVVQYDAADPRGELKLQLCERQHLAIEWISADSAGEAAVRYEQPRLGTVKLIVNDPSPREYVAPSLWHLWLAEPKVCQEHLLPLLEPLTLDWRLGEQAAAIQQELLAAAAEADVAAEEKTWQKLVDDLAGESFRRRQAADVNLREGGQSAAAFLRRLPPQSLSVEQRLRIERICRSQADSAPDTPQRVAAWLLGDRGMWIGFLAHQDVAVRLAAAEHLSRLAGREIGFNPHADEKTRELQLAEVARRISRR